MLNVSVRPHITRRGIQIALGLLWSLDGLLQFQPAMLTRRFATQVIAPAGQGQPAFVSGPVREAARIILLHPAAMGVGFGLVQLALGLGILCARTARWALAASAAWALSVWYLGEGLGGLFGNHASMLTGAPGAALVYAILALAVRPRRVHGVEVQRPSRWATIAWAVLWLGGAVLELLPGMDTNASISMSLAMNASGVPGWFAAIDNRLSALVPYTGVSIVVDLVVLQAFAGLGVFRARRARMAALIVGMSLSLAYWIAGQDMGQFWSGMATDPNTAPLLVLLGVAAGGSAPWREAALVLPDGYLQVDDADAAVAAAALVAASNGMPLPGLAEVEELIQSETIAPDGQFLRAGQGSAGTCQRREQRVARSLGRSRLAGPGARRDRGLPGRRGQPSARTGPLPRGRRPARPGGGAEQPRRTAGLFPSRPPGPRPPRAGADHRP
jgi:hypothetical protein